MDIVFVGEDSIEHTSKNETVTLNIGQAFDVEVKVTQSDTWKSGIDQHNKFECRIRNHKEESVTIVYDPVLPSRYEMVHSTHPYSKVDDRQIKFTETICKNREITIQFETRKLAP